MTAEDPVLATLLGASRQVLTTLDAGARRPPDDDLVLATLARARHNRWRRRARRTAGAMALLLALGAAGWWRLHARDRLDYTIEGGQIAEGSLRARGAELPRVRFSDGTVLAFAAGTRARLLSVHRAGARVVLDDGSAQVDVVHRAGADWQIDAGPYNVAVTGTAFRVAWTPGEGAFELELRRGSVVVHGPLAETGLVLTAGHRLSARPSLDRITVAAISAQPVDHQPPAPRAAAEPARPLLPRPRPPRRAAAIAAGPDEGTVWGRQIASGDFAGVLASAQRRGLDTTIVRGSVTQLAALADAARYDRRPDLARRALLVLRRRFPDSPQASDAAFLLGRLEEEREGDEAALLFYDRYLEEAPHGRFASDAWGRKLTVVRRRDGPGPAAQLAREYLRRFPDGPYASLAAALARAQDR
jgi:FecR-like protein